MMISCLDYGIIYSTISSAFLRLEGWIISEKRKDSKGRILKTGESQRKDGTYQYRYKDNHKKAHYVYSPNLEGLREK